MLITGAAMWWHRVVRKRALVEEEPKVVQRATVPDAVAQEG
jgi:hypothetical protein